MELADAARDEAAFSMRVLRHLACGRDGGASNLAVSPLSLHAALALLGAGARGATLDQIVAFLGPAGGNAHAKLASHVALRVLSSDTTGWDGGPTVLFSNGVWLDTALQLSDSFARVVAEHYRAVARLAPFKAMPEEARSQINEWIASATAGRIRNLIPPGSINTATPAVLANALYFKGDWSRKFDALLASYDAFYVPNGGPVRVPFMSSTSKQYIARRHGYKVLRLPYAGASQEKTFSMYIYLPDDHHGLPSLLQKLSSDPALLESSTTLTSDVPMGAFRVPKFTVSYKTNVKEMLRDLGLRLPLNSGLADFGDMVEAPPPADPFFVSEVYHECVVDVNEEGTEAFAATSFCMRATGFQRADAPEDFVADHPFMFFIKEDRSGVVVFAGQVIDPSHRMWTHP